MQQPSPSEETNNLLTRLSSRPGVQSTLILSRSTGAIVRSTGLITAEDLAQTTTEDTPTAPNANGTSDSVADGQKSKKGTREAEQVAGLVWRFVHAAGDATEGLWGEGDETRLVRLRSKRNEVVVVPDRGFLLVVVHDTPPA